MLSQFTSNLAAHHLELSRLFYFQFVRDPFKGFFDPKGMRVTFWCSNCWKLSFLRSTKSYKLGSKIIWFSAARYESLSTLKSPISHSQSRFQQSELIFQFLADSFFCFKSIKILQLGSFEFFFHFAFPWPRIFVNLKIGVALWCGKLTQELQRVSVWSWHTSIFLLQTSA